MKTIILLLLIMHLNNTSDHIRFADRAQSESMVTRIQSLATDTGIDVICWEDYSCAIETDEPLEPGWCEDDNDNVFWCEPCAE
jgi:hypothetical protein